MRYVILAAVAFVIGCYTQPSLRECKIACKGNLREFNDEIVSCSCFEKGEKR